MITTETEIEHFIELYNTGNFTRAAIRLGITQPTLTQSILRVERKLNVKVFHRSKQGCVPTQAGQIFYGRATHLQEVWKSLGAEISKSETALSGLFRVGCHESVGIYALPRFVKKLAEDAPLIGLRIHHDWSRRVTEKIINHELDLGFVINPVRHRDLVLLRMGSDRVALWKSKESASPPRRLLTDLDLSQIRKLFGKHGLDEFQEWPIVETPSLEVVRAMTQEGAGFGILPERVARIGSGGLEIVKASPPMFNDEIYLAYRADTMRGAAGRAVIDSAKKCIKK